MEYTINHKKLFDCNLNEVIIYNNDISCDVVLSYIKDYFNIKDSDIIRINYRSEYKDYYILTNFDICNIFICSDLDPKIISGTFFDKKNIIRDLKIKKILSNI